MLRVLWGEWRGEGSRKSEEEREEEGKEDEEEEDVMLEFIRREIEKKFQRYINWIKMERKKVADERQREDEEWWENYRLTIKELRRQRKALKRIEEML